MCCISSAIAACFCANGQNSVRIEGSVLGRGGEEVFVHVVTGLSGGGKRLLGDALCELSSTTTLWERVTISSESGWVNGAKVNHIFR